LEGIAGDLDAPLQIWLQATYRQCHESLESLARIFISHTGRGRIESGSVNRRGNTSPSELKLKVHSYMSQPLADASGVSIHLRE